MIPLPISPKLALRFMWEYSAWRIARIMLQRPDYHDEYVSTTSPATPCPSY